jgi:hypothetical protein
LSRRSCLIVPSLLVALIAPSTTAFAARSSQPENDAAALVALQARDPTKATTSLRASIGSVLEPAEAKVYARQALKLIGEKKGAQAGMPAEKGASVERLTWALADLNAKSPSAASGQLMQAAKLPDAAKAATGALHAIAAHKIAEAVADLRTGLKALGA